MPHRAKRNERLTDQLEETVGLDGPVGVEVRCHPVTEEPGCALRSQDEMSVRSDETGPAVPIASDHSGTEQRGDHPRRVSE